MTTESARLESLCVLHQSDDYIVVDKHWDIRIDSKMWYEKHTVQAQLGHRFPELSDPSTYYGFRSESHGMPTASGHVKVNVRIDSLAVFLSTGSVISWISPRAGRFASPSIRPPPAELTAASRTAPSPKPTSPW